MGPAQDTESANTYWQCRYYGCAASSPTGNPASNNPSTVATASNATSFTAVPGNSQINLAWLNPPQSTFTKVRLVRSPTGYPLTPNDGALVYEGTGSGTLDNALLNNAPMYYTLFSYDSTLPVSSGVKAAAAPSIPISTVWGKTTVSSEIDNQFHQVVADSAGGAIAVGRMKSYSVGGSTLKAVTYASGMTVYTGGFNRTTSTIVKYSSTGAVSWAKSVSNCPDESSFAAVAIDATGNIYAVGHQFGTYACDYGNGITLSGSGTSINPVLVKYNSSGITQWARSLDTNPGQATFTGIAIDPAGFPVISGMLAGNTIYDLGNGVSVSTPSATLTAPLILKTNTAGATIWGRSVQAASDHAAFLAVAVDSTGSALAVGLHAHHYLVNYGNGIQFAAGSGYPENGVIVKYDSNGVPVWARGPISSSNSSRFNAVAVDNSGNAYVVADQTGNSPYYYGENIQTAGPAVSVRSGALIKYSINGTPLWARSHESAANETLYTSVAIGANNTIFVGGYSFGSGAQSFGNGIATNILNWGGNPLLVRFSATGISMAAKSLFAGPNSSAHIRYSGICTTISGAIYAVGYLTSDSSFEFGNGVSLLANDSGQNSFIVKYQ